ncbi:PQQ-dependent sugar dehydrogenase [Vulcaniibacterium tengchongense]|uniref:Pyrroloquinoline quinone-dependent pyranose dehydrogenase beta-propeller domain-containing protein n=1 Tax=Vulcaniibacterium tengchongense TaxID=1273429 RepID=A0A3N4VKH3_9GAMM|nr:sorbosone dehydrogenase family protein [Vulcaniibacterium tengchongense]RPE79781.1 hypothetical protein EDC50_1607 [Vulcaniibacterium tengchongense]
MERRFAPAAILAVGPRAAGPIAAALLAALLGACGHARLLAGEDTGPTPTLAPPRRTPLPTVDIAPARGWPADAAPVAAPGLRVRAFARGLRHPRWLHVLPNGDVLVAESGAPPGKSGIRGLKGLAMAAVMKRAGAAVPSADRITLLRDADGNGRAELRSAFAEGLDSPFGMALVGDALYVANAGSLVRFRYREGDTRARGAAQKVVDLPGKGDEPNHHWTKSLLAAPGGTRLYVGVGANSNVGENGLAAERDRAAVLEVDPARGAVRAYATGLRNPVGLDWEPRSGALWAAVNERDELGSDLVPDYLARLERGAFYGWPHAYWGAHPDPRVRPARPDRVAAARTPDYALGAHVAPLGLAFARDARLGPGYAEGAFVGLHGSWNRRPLAGYKVVFVPFRDGTPSGPMREVLGGFLDAAGRAYGRPAGVAVDRRGALLVADDAGDAVWRVERAAP